MAVVFLLSSACQTTHKQKKDQAQRWPRIFQEEATPPGPVGGSMHIQRTRTSAWKHQDDDRLCGPISRDIAIVSLRYPLLRDTFSAIPVIPQQGAIPPLCLVLHRHINSIPHFANYRAILVRYPRKTSTKEFCATIAERIARYEKYRCWAS